MFKSKCVNCFLSGFAGHGDDTDNKELKLTFQVSPISQELASEVSPRLADRLFRFEEDEWRPSSEISKAAFASLQIKMQNIEFYELPEFVDTNQGTMVENGAISNLRASRATNDSAQFKLEFDVVVSMNAVTMRLVEKFYKAGVFLTMTEVQRTLEFSGGDSEVSVSLQDAADSAPAVDGKSAGAGDDSGPEAPRRGRRKKDA